MGAIALPRTRTHVHNLLEQELKREIDSKLVREVAKYLVPPEETRTFDLLSQVMTGLAESGNRRT